MYVTSHQVMSAYFEKVLIFSRNLGNICYGCTFLHQDEILQTEEEISKNRKLT